MPKILIVEDNEENRDSLSRRLTRRGFDVVSGSDGNIGISTAQSEKPDLILMDMNMPELDGWEATRRLKEIAETKDIPVIGLTAYAMSGDRERALQSGCADYHAKPLEFDKLIIQIETLVQQRTGAPQTPV